MKTGRNTEIEAFRFIRYLVPGIVVITLLTYVILDPGQLPASSKENSNQPKQGTEVSNFGLPKTEGFELIKGQCSGCHSLKLVAQNKLTRQGWKDLIVWMQQEQNLWDLGDLEKPILDYLETNCSPVRGGRRKLLPKTEWYALD